MCRIRILISLGFSLFIVNQVLGQDSIILPKMNPLHGQKILDIQFNYTYQWPDGDMALRYGPIHNIGFGGLFLTKQHWVFGGEIAYQFGNTVKETAIFINLTNSSGYVMNSNGAPADYSFSERGLNTFVKAGRFFPLSRRYRNSGILLLVGGGYMLHKINFTNTSNDIPALTAELKKGYDRLTGGYALTEFVGFIHHSPNRYFNFYLGFDFIQGFTQSIRGYNYDQMQYDTQKRHDYLNGIRIGWMIPIYLTTHQEDEFDFK